MALIPKFVSKERVTTEPPSGYMQPKRFAEAQTPEVAAKISGGAALEDIGRMISGVSEKILAISNANAESQANIDSTLAFATIEDKINKNPDLDHALDNVDNDINAIRNNVSKNFIDPRAKAEYLNQFDLKSTIFKLGLKTNIQKKQIDRGRVNTLKEIDLEASNYINAITLKEKLASRQVMDSIMQRAIDLQLFTREQGYDELNKTIKAADEATKDLEGLRKRKEKEIEFAIKEAKNAREEELIQMRVNKTMPLEDLIKQARIDMNAIPPRIDPKFAEIFINSCKTPPTTEPTPLEGIIKYNELVERNTNMIRKEKSWLNTWKVPFEEITKFRADIFDANAKGYISDKQMTDLLKETSKTFYRDPIFQNALNQLAAQSKLYATSEAQARIKAEMYGDLITKVITGKEPRQAVQEVIQERLNTELGEAIKVISEMPSEEDIQFTMKKHNLTREAVLEKLGI